MYRLRSGPPAGRTKGKAAPLPRTGGCVQPQMRSSCPYFHAPAWFRSAGQDPWTPNMILLRRKAGYRVSLCLISTTQPFTEIGQRGDKLRQVGKLCSVAANLYVHRQIYSDERGFLFDKAGLNFKSPNADKTLALGGSSETSFQLCSACKLL